MKIFRALFVTILWLILSSAISVGDEGFSKRLEDMKNHASRVYSVLNAALFLNQTNSIDQIIKLSKSQCRKQIHFFDEPRLYWEDAPKWVTKCQISKNSTANDFIVNVEGDKTVKYAKFTYSTRGYKIYLR
jgi:hypothetical protein